jgi:hypothetical protein
MTGQQLAVEVLRELDVIAGTDTADQADVSYVLSKINRVLDNWSAEYGPAYCDSITSYTLTPALQPHTIGPSTATFTVTQRPMSIEAISTVVSSVRTPICPRDVDWWMAQSDQATTGAEPTDFYYRPASPNGSLYFYPVPSAATVIEIQTRVLLAQLTLTGTAILPPGYQDALILTAAEACAPHFHAAPPNALAASKARARIAAANSHTPRLVTDAPGVTRGVGWDNTSGAVR